MTEAGEKGLWPDEARRALKALSDEDFPEGFVKNNLSNTVQLNFVFGIQNIT